MRARVVLLAVVVAAGVILAGAAHASGTPAGTPRWLTELTRQKATAFGDPDPERADGELAPAVRLDLIVELPVTTGLDLVQHEPRPVAQRVRGDVLRQ